MQIGEVPDLFGPIADDHFLVGAAPAAMAGFRIQALAELLCRLDGTGVGGRERVTNGKAFLVIAGLGKDTSQFDFPGTSGLAIDFSRPTLGLGAHHGYAGAIELDIEHGKWGDRSGWADPTAGLDSFPPAGVRQCQRQSPPLYVRPLWW